MNCESDYAMYDESTIKVQYTGCLFTNIQGGFYLSDRRIIPIRGHIRSVSSGLETKTVERDNFPLKVQPLIPPKPNSFSTFLKNFLARLK